MFTPDLFLLAMDIESRGLAGREDAVLRVVRAARVAGLSRVSIDVLADRQQPDVARMRAFGNLAAGLGRLRGRSSIDHAA